MRMKGFLRGLRYFSQMFETKVEEEKEDEMQIGYPTDVKHVAHIGCDGSSADNTPSWMNQLQSAPPRDVADPAAAGDKNPPRDPNTGSGTARDAAPRRASKSIKQSGRHHSSGGGESPSREPSDGTRQGRKHRSTAETASSDPPCAPKQSNRRKPKGSSSAGGGNSMKSSAKSKAAIASTESESGDEERRSNPMRGGKHSL